MKVPSIGILHKSMKQTRTWRKIILSTKHVHLDLEEVDKLEKQKKAKVFADLVLYDEREKPYVDVNRLIYKLNRESSDIFKSFS